MRKADFIVDIQEYWGENVDDALLQQLGFQAMDVASINPECYRIWQKRKQPVTSAAIRPGRRSHQSDGQARAADPLSMEFRPAVATQG